MRDGRRIELPPEFNYEAHKQAHPLAPCVGPEVKNPTILFETLDAPRRQDRIMATIRCDEHKKARRYVGELEISKDGGASVTNRRRKAVGAKRDNDSNTTVDINIGRVNPKWKVRFRVRADDDSCLGAWKPGTSLVPSDAEAGWSDWFDPTDTEVPPAVTGLTLDVDQNRSHIRWTLPDEPGNIDIPDLRISHLWVELWKDALDSGTLIARDRYHHGERKHVRNPKPGSATYFARVYTVSHTGKKSTAATTSATRSTPSQPAAPSVSFDAGGPRNAKYRAHVTVATVADTDAEIAKYLVQLVHKSTHVAPTSADKRSHGRVEGDATGEDLIETFRGIPKAHWVYARTRAVDTQGRRSTWSVWTDAGQPSADAEDDGADPGTSKRYHGGSLLPGYLLEDGASYATALYPDLFAAIGYVHGGSGANFNVPDSRGRHSIGASSVYGLGANDGLAEASRLTGHSHVNDATDATPGSDGTGQTPNSDSTGEATHNHGAGTLATSVGGPHTHATGGLVTANQPAHDHGAGGLGTGAGGSPIGRTGSAVVDASTDTHTHNVTGSTGTAGSHSHNVSGDTGGQTAGHSHNVTGGTSAAGTSHGHGHNHASHGHTHGHGAHGHNHGHGAQSRPHKAVKWQIKT